MGRFVRLAGWAIGVVAAVVYAWRILDMAGDPSVQAYWPLVAAEGLALVGAGIAVIALGRWLERGDIRHLADGGSAEPRKRKLLVWLFRGQSLVSVAAALWLAASLAMSPADSPSADETAYSLSMLMIFLVLGGVPWWIGLRLKRGLGTVSATLYSGISLFAFPVGTVLGGMQLFLLREISRGGKP
ncbi:hypothetical protein [Magnetospirillum sp. SS-4]|uniref:hypothetical protein n=1 Tax=Magnetospirillum sp. SS-4 TaxID=2681465 RepID=UPI0013807DDE|nr:hypothetical protein [Magnetospirillum sp. SS-4]CAA7621363.1 membrane hypothetical protein [Magnetospirillum sp. SS-4]